MLRASTSIRRFLCSISNKWRTIPSPLIIIVVVFILSFFYLICWTCCWKLPIVSSQQTLIEIAQEVKYTQVLNKLIEWLTKSSLHPTSIVTSKLESPQALIFFVPRNGRVGKKVFTKQINAVFGVFSKTLNIHIVVKQFTNLRILAIFFLGGPKIFSHETERCRAICKTPPFHVLVKSSVQKDMPCNYLCKYFNIPPSTYYDLIFMESSAYGKV